MQSPKNTHKYQKFTKKNLFLLNEQYFGGKKTEIIHAYPELENSKSLPVFEKTITATSASQRMASSWAFLSNPALLFENVTCLLFVFSIFLISIFPLPIIIFSWKHKDPIDQKPQRNQKTWVFEIKNLCRWSGFKRKAKDFAFLISLDKKKGALFWVAKYRKEKRKRVKRERDSAFLLTQMAW